MNTATIEDEKWGVIEAALARAGVNTALIRSAISRRRIIEQAEADDVIGQDEDAWRLFADMILEEHPAWKTGQYTRRKHAEDLLESWEQRGDDGSTVADLVEHKYALVSWYDSRSFVHSCGDNYVGVAEVIVTLTHLEEYPESPEFFVDLDTGEQNHLYGKDPVPMQSRIELTICGETYVYTNDNQKKEQQA